MGILRSSIWGTAFVAAGALVAGGWLPGSAAWQMGPRIGVATFLAVTGLTVIAFALVPWVLRKTTKPADYEGGCPVGATCGCGQFNFKPRKSCRQCGKATTFTVPA